jgi:hypothetical protein
MLLMSGARLLRNRQRDRLILTKAAEATRGLAKGRRPQSPHNLFLCAQHHRTSSISAKTSLAHSANVSVLGTKMDTHG